MPPLLVEAVRLPFLTGSLLPVLMVWAYCWQVYGKAQVGLLLLTLLGVGLLHLGSNLFNDYCDAKGSDPLNQKVTPFSGGSRVIQDGRMSSQAVLALAFCCFSGAIACALMLVLAGRPGVLLVGGAGLLIGLIYSWGPWALMSRGLGELCIFLAFGPVLTWGAGYVFTGQFTWLGFWWGLPLGWLITAILWINQFPDYDADKKAGKNNLVVRLGLARSRIWYVMLMMAPFLSLVLLVECLGITGWIYMGLHGLPLAIRASVLAWRRYDDFEGIVPVQRHTILTHMVTGGFIILGLLIHLALAGEGSGAIPLGQGGLV